MFYIILAFLIAFISCDYPCQDIYPFHSTKTPYEAVRGVLLQNTDCSLENIWMLVRNGERFPDESDISVFSQMDVVQTQILENHDKYHSGELCKKELDELRSWKFSVNKKQARSLSPAGHAELASLGTDVSRSFSHIFHGKSLSDLNLKITSQKISNESAEAFMKGIFRRSLKIPNSAQDDQLLMNEKNCPGWDASTNSAKLRSELFLLENSLDMERLLIEVKERLGFLRSVPQEMVNWIYELCAYESSWSPEMKSPWCPAFTTQHLKVLEFKKDLMYYYKFGYGNPFTRVLGCTLLADLIKWMNSADRKPTFYFGDSLAIFKLLISLGIAGDDPPLRGDAFQTSDDREWRTSIINPFSSNIMAVLYKCSEKSSTGLKEKMKVVFYLNEYIIQLPACLSPEGCNVDEFVKYFGSVTDPSVCNRDFCHKKF